MNIKNMTNIELLNEFERSIIHSTVTQCNSGRGTKGIDKQIDKIREELTKRLSKQEMDIMKKDYVYVPSQKQQEFDANFEDGEV